MDEIDKGEFGGFEDDVEGEVATRKVQTGGRVNLPSRFLGYISIEEGDKILVSAEDNSLILRKASVDSLAVTKLMEGTMKSLEDYYDAEGHNRE